MDFYPSRASEPESRRYLLSLTGANGADPTVRVGEGVTVTRTAEGVYKVAFNDAPGTFIGITGHTFRADTPSDVKGYTLTGDTYVAPTSTADGYIEVSVWDSSFAAADIIAAQYLDLQIEFRQTA